MSPRLIRQLRSELERRHKVLLKAETSLDVAQENFDEIYEILETALLFNKENAG